MGRTSRRRPSGLIRRSWSDRSGFSVLEMLAVLVLMAIVGVIVTPPVAQFAQRRNASTAADEFAGVHSLARSAAMKYGRLARLGLDPSKNRYWVEVDTSDTGPADTLRIVSDLTKRGVRLTTDKTLLCLDARGIATSRGSCGTGLATIVFSAQSHVDTVLVTVAGNVIR